MAFSFTPGQITPQGGQAQAAPGTVTPGTSLAPTGPPSDSPFLFIRERDQPLSVMACVQIVLAAAALSMVIVSIVLFVYSFYLTSSITSKKTELDSMESLAKDYPFAEMRELSSRLSGLDTLLKSYVSSRSPLKFLENVVENQVVFNDFTLTQSLAGAYSINFTVITNNYKTLIQQLESLNLKEYSKVAPSPKSNGLLDSSALIKIKVTTPIFVQGILPDELIFINQDSKASSTPPLVTGSSTP